MIPQDIFKKNQILTLSIAKQLKGKKIATTYPVYRMNEPRVIEFTVGEIVPQEMLWSNQDANFLKKMRKQYGKVFELLDENGNGTSIRAHIDYNDIFTCSDIDRPVFYIEL